jgi:hemerythrin
METIEWRESFSVGNVLMDAHHQVFLQMVKEFRETAGEADTNTAREQIEFLIEYTAMHLGAEEELMQRAGYPDLAGHKAMHEEFVRKVRTMAAALDTRPDSLSSDEILQLVQDWLVTHILGDDKRYAPYVKNLSV